MYKFKVETSKIARRSCVYKLFKVETSKIARRRWGSICCTRARLQEKKVFGP